MSDDAVLCYAPSTLVRGHADGYAGGVAVSVAIGGGSGGTPDDVDYVRGDPLRLRG